MPATFATHLSCNSDLSTLLQPHRTLTPICIIEYSSDAGTSDAGLTAFIDEILLVRCPDLARVKVVKTLQQSTLFEYRTYLGHVGEPQDKADSIENVALWHVRKGYVYNRMEW